MTEITCERSREALSALADGEVPGVDRRSLDAHVRRCDACRRFRAVAERPAPGTSVGAAPQLPDLSLTVPRLVALADRAATYGVARVLLAVVAVQILVFSVPSLVALDEAGSIAHDSRHLGAFTVAYAVALVVVVLRPARARTVLPAALVLAAGMVITAFIDLANGNVPLAGEVLHVPEILSVGLVSALARRNRSPRPGTHEPPPATLHLVDAAERDRSI